MQGIVYAGDRRAEKLNGKCQMMKRRSAQAGCLRRKWRKQRSCPAGHRGEMKNPAGSLSPTFQTSPVPHVSQMQLENSKLTTDSPNKALICGICQFLQWKYSYLANFKRFVQSLNSKLGRDAQLHAITVFPPIDIIPKITSRADSPKDVIK